MSWTPAATGLEVYKSGIEKLKNSIPLELKDVSSEHQRLRTLAIQTFMKRSFRDTDWTYLNSLEENIMKLIEEFLSLNEQASKSKCEDLLSSLSAQMTENFKQGFYTRPGGYNLFCKDRKDIVQKYNIQAKNKVKAEEVLEEFLKQKSVEFKAILQADRKLTEKEKKIKEEEEEAALLKQEIKAKEEKQRQLEEKMERCSNEMRMGQMKQLMDEEMKLQRLEGECAMESKLREQEALLEKGFKEKAYMMTWEMDMFKRQSSETESNRAREFAVMLENSNRRYEETMAMMMQQYTEKMKDIKHMNAPYKVMDKPVCLIDTESDGKLCVQQSALQILQEIDQPVVVVAVVGLYRTGKSYLMNQLAGKPEGFALGSTNESKTKGIWMWCVPHPTEKETTLVLLDIEGLGDTDKHLASTGFLPGFVKAAELQHDTNIFCLAVLLSSTLVYNSRGTIDNRAIEELQYVTGLTDCIKVKSSDEDADESSEFVKFFPSFIWAVRDFTLERKIDGKDATENEYLEFALNLKNGTGKKVMEYNLPRECIRTFFPSRTCFTFPFPTAPENVSRLESLNPADLSPDFLKVTDHFCKFVFQKSQVKKLKGGYTVTGRVLGNLAKTYVDTISSGAVPCLENAVMAMATIENEAAVKEGLEVYKSGMEKLKDSFPLELKDLSSEHQQLSNLATQTFMKRSFRDTNGKYLKSLEEIINNLFERYLSLNEQASKKRCEDLLLSLSAQMMENFKQGFYTRPGGYDISFKDLEDIVQKYYIQAKKEVKAEEVLDVFLKQMSEESKAILHADKKLSEDKKMIKEEEEEAALLNQEIKAKKQKQRQLEAKMNAERQINEQNMIHMKQKMDEEMELQRLEAERAMESKVREQAALLEKGFKEKADMMTWEMEEIKRQSAEAENNRAREFAEMLENSNKRHEKSMAMMMQQHTEEDMNPRCVCFLL